MEWEQVLTDFNQLLEDNNHAGRKRIDPKSLERKFNDLCTHDKPTGDPA